MTLRVSTASLTLEVDEETGAIATLHNRPAGLDLITRRRREPPFRLGLAGHEVVTTVLACRAVLHDGRIAIEWDTDRAVTLVADIAAGRDDIRIHVSATNSGGATIDRIEYPILDGVGRLAGPGHDTLIHPQATGMLFHDPLDLIEPDPDNRRRLASSPYPEGFAGSTMQFMAYAARRRGGFYLATEDPATNLKWFNVFASGDGLALSIVHKVGLPTASASFSPDYPVVLAALAGGSWTDAADRYRTWVLDQPFGAAAPRASWLRRAVGISTFGINARHDRSAWLDEIHRIAGTPVFHVLGPNWARTGQDYQSHLPKGRGDWFPASFNDANLATIRRNGDRWAPFEFDLLCGHDPARPEPVLESRIVHDPDDVTPTDAGLLGFPLMCAGTDYWHDFHAERDARLIADHDPDALYYDISVSNLLMECLAANHRHLPGAGANIIESFRRMYRDTATATAAAKGAEVPSGTEVMTEVFQAQFDYYQARAEAGPYAPFEAAPFRDWVLAGRAEKIPLFTYVFGSRSPVRMDGWSKLSAGTGDLFYWTAATVLLNGGLFELNYEFSPLEDLSGRSDEAAEHYYPFAERHDPIDPAKASFVRTVARTRIGPANRFLADGEMLPAPPIDAPPITLDWRAWNMSMKDVHYDTHGEMTVPSALATAWQVDGRTAWLVANIAPSRQTIRVDGRAVDIGGRDIVLIEG